MYPGLTELNGLLLHLLVCFGSLLLFAVAAFVSIEVFFLLQEDVTRGKD